MKVGLLTGPFKDRSFEEVVQFASEAGFDALEVAGTHIDPQKLTPQRAAEISTVLREQGVEISSLAAYLNITDPDPEKRKAHSAYLKSAVDAAVLLNVEAIPVSVSPPRTV